MGIAGKISKRRTNAILKKHMLDLDDSIQEVYDIADENSKKIENNLEQADSKLRKTMFDEYKGMQQKTLNKFADDMKVQKEKMNNGKIALYNKIINS